MSPGKSRVVGFGGSAQHARARVCVSMCVLVPRCSFSDPSKQPPESFYEEIQRPLSLSTSTAAGYEPAPSPRTVYEVPPPVRSPPLGSPSVDAGEYEEVDYRGVSAPPPIPKSSGKCTCVGEAHSASPWWRVDVGVQAREEATAA